MYYIFNTKQDAIDANAVISKEQGYSNNLTSGWCNNPIELIYGRFAMPYIECIAELPAHEIVESISDLVPQVEI